METERLARLAYRRESRLLRDAAVQEKEEQKITSRETKTIALCTT